MMDFMEVEGSYQTLTKVLESIDAHIYVADMDSYEIRYMNKDMQKAFGEDFTGEICYEVFRGEDKPCKHCTNELLLDEEGEPADVHIWEGQNPLTGQWYVNHDRALCWHDGRLVRIQIATDITERKQMEAALQESKSRYRQVSEMTSDYAYAFRVESNGELVREWVTGALTKITGYTADELRAQGGWEAMIHPDDLASTHNQLKTLLSGEAQTIEYRVIHKDNSLRWTRDYGRPKLDEESGRVTHIYGAIQDITSQVLAQVALRENEEKYRQLFELESDAVFLIENESGQILDVNSFASEMYGYDRDELLAMKNTELSAEPDETRKVTESTPIAENQIVSIPIRYHQKKDGTIFAVEISGRFFRLQGQEVHLAAVRDITARNQAEQVLKDEEARYRTLFTESPIVLWEEDMSEVKKYIDNLREQGVVDWRSYFDENGSAVKECLGRVKILNVNKTAIDFYEASSAEEVMSGLDKLFTEESFQTFKDELVSFAECATLFECEVKTNTLTKKTMDVWMRVSIPKGYEETWEMVYVSAIDISILKAAEEELKRRTDEMAALHAVTLDLASSADLEPLLVSITARATELLDGSSGGLYLCDLDKREVRCVVSFRTVRDFSGAILRFGEGAAGIVAETGLPLIIDDYRKWEKRAQVFDGEDSIQKIMSVPIVWQEQVQGVLHIMRDSGVRNFSQDDLDLLSILANHAAIAIENARLLHQIQRHAGELEERVDERTYELRTMVNVMAGREGRMADLKEVIKKLRRQIKDAGMTPVADDPLNVPLI